MHPGAPQRIWAPSCLCNMFQGLRCICACDVCDSMSHVCMCVCVLSDVFVQYLAEVYVLGMSLCCMYLGLFGY